MRKQMLVRRVVAVGCVVAAGCSIGAVVPPAGASVSPSRTTFSAGGYASASPSDNTTCQKTVKDYADDSEPNNGNPITVPVDGKTRSYHAKVDTHAGQSDLSGSSTVTGSFRRTAAGGLSLSSHGSVSSTASTRVADPTCTAHGSVWGGLGADVVLPVRTWYVADLSGSSQGTTNVAAEVQTADVSFELWTYPGSSTMRILPAGSYQVSLGGTAKVAVAPRATGTVTSSFRYSGSAHFYPLGSLRSQVGAGQHFVTFGNRNCKGWRVRAHLNKWVAARARSVTFYVDGKQRAVLTGRALRRHSKLLTHLRAKSYGKVRAVIVKKTGAKKVVNASSWPCA